MRKPMLVDESTLSNHKRKRSLASTLINDGDISTHGLPCLPLQLGSPILVGESSLSNKRKRSLVSISKKGAPRLTSLPLPVDLVDVPISLAPAFDETICDMNIAAAPVHICTTSSLVGFPIICGVLDPFSTINVAPQDVDLGIQLTKPAFFAFHDVSNIPLAPTILPIVASCKFCCAKRFYRESRGFCCGSGQIKLYTHPTPNEIWALFTSTNAMSKKFKQYVRPYNNMFAFTSFGVRYDTELSRKYKGISTFKAQGQVYHYMNALLPCDKPPQNLQLYFYDTEHEIHNRLQVYNHLDSSVIVFLRNVLNINPYSQFFSALINVANLEECRIIIRTNTSVDQRVFNAPAASEVAAMWVENEVSENASSRDIIVYSKSGSPIRIQYYYGCYDPLQYPLLFPLGESGWHQGIKRIKKNAVTSAKAAMPEMVAFSTIEQLVTNEAKVMAVGKTSRDAVSCREYYCYKLQMRPNCKCVLLHCSRLLQQFCVDMYIKLESSRLDFFRSHQKHIRSEVYGGIVDSINSGERRGFKIGKRIILPATFIGGPRDMRRRYLDAMTLVQRYGKPDIFLTMTCNPSWPEIKDNLLPGEHSQNRPDLVARVFRAKFYELKHIVIKKELFGKVLAYVYVIEFQKRGLPHSHILLILAEKDKIRTNEHIDRFVSAEIPDQSINPHLYHAVCKHMMHGPCGFLNPSNSCMRKNGSCKDHYPKQFCSKTTQTENSYPLYRRRNNNVTVNVRNEFLDNRWVIPYNAYLLAKFDCHINVELCISMKAIKYVYKYIYKGHDRISFQLTSSNSDDIVDEISSFQNARWISPPEAMWRIYKFLLNELSPAVMPLQLHLEHKQLISYHDSSDLQNVLDYSLCKKTTLTEYFHMNDKNINEAKNFLYREFPEHFTWNYRDKAWQLRKQVFCIGRIVSVNPIEGDRYYLRLLLNNIKGATSFNNLKVVNGVQCESFREAALLHGLIEVDDCYRICLYESCVYQMPKSLRRLFSTLLVYCNPPNTRGLWEEFRMSFSEDFLRVSGVSHMMAYKLALKDIACQLESMGKNINDYKLVDDYLEDIDISCGSREMNDELAINVPLCDITNVSLLNPAQKNAFDIIFNRFLSESPGAFFIDGPGGTGKSFLYSVLLANVRCKGHIALATASSGVAASVLPGGRTAHSRFKIPLNLDDFLSCNVSKQSGLAKLVQATRLIVWDEAPMVRRQAIEAFERMLRDICESDEPFGGKLVVFGGDFRQILPVIPKGSIEQTIEASLVKSPLWASLEKLRLIENVRARFDPNFSKFLLNIGNGDIETVGNDEIQLPSFMILPFEGPGSLNTLLQMTFPNLKNYSTSPDTMINRAVLSTTNEFVDEINSVVISQFPDNVNEYRSFDETIEHCQEGLQEEFFNSLTPSGFPPHILKLKVNCPVILLRNIDPSQGLCNGTRLICKTFNQNTIGAVIATGAYYNKHVFLPRIPFTPSSDDISSVPFRRKQFPIKLCFCMTINKAQGQTLEFVGIYLPQPVFSHGQLYVALSRARVATAIAVLIVPTEDNKSINSPTTRNVVHKEVLTLAAAE